MKKTMLLALCVILAGLLAVNGTLADDFGRAINKAFQIIEGWTENAAPEVGGQQVDVQLQKADPIMLMPGAPATYDTAVNNVGSDDVYFRVAVAVRYDEQSWDKLDFEFNADGFDTSDWMDTTISGTPYKMMVLTYQEALAAKSSAPFSVTVSMDTSITSEQMDKLSSNFLQMQVLAISASEFTDMSATAALDMALPLTNFNPF